MTGHRKAYWESYAGVALAAVVTMLLAPLTARAQCTVTDNSDNPSDTGSLRYCVAQANAATSPYTITFASSLNGQVISITTGPLYVTGSAEVTIQGPGANQLIISGEGGEGLVIVESNSDLIISGLTMANSTQLVENLGALTMSNCTISGSSGKVEAIYNIGTLSVTSSTFTDNTGPAIGTNAGAVFLGNSTISGNGGFGIWAEYTTLTVNNSSIYGNTTSPGHGIYMYAGTVDVNNSTISGNAGCGLEMDFESELTLNNSTISGNADCGVDLFETTGVTVSNSTISGNNTEYLGGPGHGIYNVGSGAVTLVNSIVAGNGSEGGDDSYGCGTQSPYNLISTSAAPVNPNLAPLGNYGGPMQTMLPLPGSPAICAGSPSLVPTGVSTDQRGFPRLNTSYTGYSLSTPCVDLGAVQTNYQSAQFPMPDAAYTGTAGAVIGIPSYPVVAVTENGQNIGGVPVTLAVSGSPSVGGLWTENTVSNVGATFSDLIVNSTGNYTLSATLGITPSVAISTAGSTNGNATLDISALGGVSVTSLSFGNQAVGTASAPQQVVLSNPNSTAISVSIYVSAGYVENDNCGGVVAGPGTCTINVSFKPTAVGLDNGTLSVVETSNGQPAGTATVSLTGTGVAGSGGEGGEGDTPTLPQWAAILMGFALAAVSIFKMRPLKQG